MVDAYTTARTYPYSQFLPGGVSQQFSGKNYVHASVLATVDAAQFSIILDILRNEKPVYGNYKTASVTTQGEGVGEGEI